jgi:lipopolysaccharide biosynthesis protein
MSKLSETTGVLESGRKVSFFRCVFDRIRENKGGMEKVHLLKRLERSLRKRRGSLFKKIFRKKSFRIFRKDSSGNPFQKYAHILHETSQAKPDLKSGYMSRTDSPLESGKLGARAIAFYLPQFHPIPENDLWWGKGFTEWTNVTRTVPQFIGHYQPRLPGDLGFYDLRVPDIMRQQVEIAKDYGIHGFCFHHYWFAGQRLLEMPVRNLLLNPDIDIDFCLCWANENWSRRWDGSESDILMAQNHSPEDDIAFIDDLIPSFKDKRYIRVNGKPVLIVYRATLLPDIAATAKRWRERVREHGIVDLYLVAAKSFDVGNPRLFGFDAGVEFPPHQAAGVKSVNDRYQIINPDFNGKIFDYADLAARYGKLDPSEFICHKAVAPSWDNCARKLGKAHTFVNSTPENYAKWLDEALEVTMRRPPEQRLLFINAWNEWGEGAYLEPDRRFGYAYLNATANVLCQTYHDQEVDDFIAFQNKQFRKSSCTAIVLHLYYEDLLHELTSEYLRSLIAADFFISVRFNASLSLLKEVTATFPNCYLIQTEHRGRDMHPFMVTLDRLVHYEYEFACKLHTKKSPQFKDGHLWRNQLLDCLVGGRDAVMKAQAVFRDDPKTGVLIPAESVGDLSERDTHVDNVIWLDRILSMMGCNRYVGKYDFKFPTGSMFWFRVSALQGMLDFKISTNDFAHELGQLDGTLAHTLERMILLVAGEREFHFREIDMSDPESKSFLSAPQLP